MRNIDSAGHLRGESLYLDDLPELEGTLHAAVFGSPVAHGRVRRLEIGPALETPGVVAVLTAAEIPGENQIGGILPDEPLLAEDEVHYDGQPMAIVVAVDEAVARRATRAIRAEIDELPAITDPREARRRGLLIQPPRTFSCGDVDAAWEDCAYVVEGVAESGGQEHLYLETQGAYAHRTEKGGLRIWSSTQGPTVVQRCVARVLGLPMKEIEVDVTRLGGGFGGKEDQASAWATMAALASLRTARPVKLVPHRLDDLRMTGTRHPYSSDFRIGLDEDLKIVAYEVTFHQNAGAAADLSPAVLERTLFHATNAYFVPNVRATAYSCRTNLAPNTAFRGFGGPQGMFVMEAAIAAVAERAGVEAAEIQRRNLVRVGDTFPYGQAVDEPTAEATWDRCAERYDLAGLRRRVAEHNARDPVRKLGLAVMPIAFGIAFTKTHMNQASVLVHVYGDGSVGVSTAAVEMGQGINTKLVQIAARVLSIDPSRVKIETTNTTRVANTSPTAASASADLNGHALVRACSAIRGRLLSLAANELGLEAGSVDLREERVVVGATATRLGRESLDWESLVRAAFFRRVDLSEHAFYATPGIHFDAETEKGSPFGYLVYGTAIVLASVDRLRGTYEIEAVHVVHDVGESLNPTVDGGQVEGGIVQGIGWMTMEEVIYDEAGRLRSGALSTYKIPDVYAAPKRLEYELFETESGNGAVYRSKAVGEPPLMYGIGAFFAIRDAIRAASPEARPSLVAPLTPERVLLALYPQGERATEAAFAEGEESPAEVR